MENEAPRNPEFAVHTLNNQGKSRADQIRQRFDNLLNDLSLVCPQGREMAMVKTKLEEACFFAKKAMALSLANQETQKPSPQ